MLVRINMRPFLFPITLGSLLLSCSPSNAGNIVINEVADKGTEGQCSGDDWVELFHVPSGQSDADPISLAGYVLHDERGSDVESFIFPSDDSITTSINPGEYLVLCRSTFEFGIGGDDTVTLLDAEGNVVSTAGPLQDLGDVDTTYIRLSDGSYEYSIVPSPGAENVVAPIPQPETKEEIRARMAQQNALGEQFFGMDSRGYTVPDKMEDIVDLEIEMLEEDYSYMMENRFYEVYSPFQSATIRSRSDGTELLSLTSPGRIRPRGQSTLFLPSCLGYDAIPFKLDFGNVNKTQTLFGVQEAYLRNYYIDRSYLREWTVYRMLARFGLPYLRTRMVRLFINGNLVGLYELMEAVDQEYVFARNFPEYDPHNFTLYKVKTMNIGCGLYSEQSLEENRYKINDASTPPYAFNRGEHRVKPVFDSDNMTQEECFMSFFGNIQHEMADIEVAYLRHNQDCGEMLVEEGIVDRDLGDSSMDPAMKTFINNHLSDNKCEEDDCSDSDLASVVDVTSFLKTFAFYAAVLNTDSPLHFGNNYYMAQTGESDNDKWKIVSWDYDNAYTEVSVLLCDPACIGRMVDWSITQPTCRGLKDSQLAGPLLLDESMHQTYLSYVRELATSVFLNETFQTEIAEHARAIQADVEQDVYTQMSGHNYTKELTTDPANLNASGLPFLPFVKARGEGLIEQVGAIEDGSYPRGPFQEENYGPWETCVDWHEETAQETACHMGCYYDGCYDPTLMVPATCDEEQGTCVHGNWDPMCNGIDMLQTYEGMEAYNNEQTFCVNGMKMSVCEPPPSESSACYRNCRYEGCWEPLWLNPGSCNEEDGTCSHGVLDPLCFETENYGSYENMTQRGDEETYCLDGMKISVCLPPSSDDSSSVVLGTFFNLAVTLLTMCLMTEVLLR